MEAPRVVAPPPPAAKTADDELLLLAAPRVTEVRERPKGKKEKPRTAKEAIAARSGQHTRRKGSNRSRDERPRSDRDRVHTGEPKALNAPVDKERAAPVDEKHGADRAAKNAKAAKAAKASGGDDVSVAEAPQTSPPARGLWARIKGLFGGKGAPSP